ncbi:MAG: MGMT family protein [Candidatus Paceibacterota bacterium]
MKTFTERAIEAALMIPEGMVTTYGRIAIAAGGGPMASRSITAILGKAYMDGQKDIPFHRIVYANGSIWIDPAHKEKRLKLYKKEGIELDEKGFIKDFHDKLFEYK